LLKINVFIFRLAGKVMSETIFREMNNVDPNERVQVGSYRVDGHGHQQLKDVTLLFLLFNYIYISVSNLRLCPMSDQMRSLR
jgi:hypothetical protein